MTALNLQGIKVLVIDDDKLLCQLLQMALLRAGAEVWTALTGEEGLLLFHEARPDVVLLDIMMPGMSGLDVCTEIVRMADVPVILLTAVSGDDATVCGLAAGAIDYVTKPFSVRVLVARVAAAVKRFTASPSRRRVSAYDDGYLHVDVGKKEVLVDGEQVNLTPIEHRLLTYLVGSPGSLVPVEELLEQVWGEEYANSPNYVHVYVSRLRSKLDPPAQESTYLDNVRGTGYRFVPRNGFATLS